jgi:hypothetical protein
MIFLTDVYATPLPAATLRRQHPPRHYAAPLIFQLFASLLLLRFIV